MMTALQVCNRLRAFPGHSHVLFARDRSRPTTVDSWRGSYDEPALGYDRTAENITAAELIIEIESACSGVRIFNGYKGGTYKFNMNQVLYVDNWSMYTDTHIKELNLKYGVVLIEVGGDDETSD